MAQNRGYEDLVVWRKAMDLCEATYAMTKTFPADERFGLVSQMNRCVISIPSNIAEGSARNTHGEFGQFLGVATGSIAELHTQLLLAKRFGYIDGAQCDAIECKIVEIRKMLNGLKASVKSQRPKLVTGNS